MSIEQSIHKILTDYSAQQAEMLTQIEGMSQWLSRLNSTVQQHELTLAKLRVQFERHAELSESKGPFWWMGMKKRKPLPDNGDGE